MSGTLRVHVLAPLAIAVALMATTMPDAPVADAAMRGDLEAVRSLVQQGADVNAPHGDGMTALHWAAERGDAAMADVLILAGAGVHAATRIGSYTPLHLASQLGHAAVVRSLLAAGADPKARTTADASEVTPLHLAAASGSAEAVAALLDAGGEVDGVDGQWGQTPLMFAADKNRADAIRVLLARGADATITGRVIDMAERNRTDRIEEERRNAALGLMLGGRGAVRYPQVPVSREEKEPADKGGLRPMTQADEIGGYGGLTALTLAVRDGNVEAATALLDGGADVNQPTAGDHTTPLLIASINGYFDLALLLLERGGDPNRVSDSGNNPLFALLSRQWAPVSKHPESTAYLDQKATYLEFMKALLEAGANPNARLRYHVWHTELSGSNLLGLNWIGATPFLRAAHATDVAAMRMLVEHGADPGIAILKPPSRGGGGAAEPDPSGLPPVEVGAPGIFAIHLATGYAYADGFVGNAHRHVDNAWLPAVRYLVEELGADVRVADYEGNTPVHNAAARGDDELILYLVSKGADVMAVNRGGQTTVDMANGPRQRTQPYPETIALLEGMGAKNNHKCVTC